MHIADALQWTKSLFMLYMTETMDATVYFLNEFFGVRSIDPTAQASNLSANEAMNSTF